MSAPCKFVCDNNDGWYVTFERYITVFWDETAWHSGIFIWALAVTTFMVPSGDMLL
jgi:hypothetical protein